MQKTIITCEIGLPIDVDDEIVDRVTQILDSIRKVPNVIYVDTSCEEVEEEE